MKLVALSCPKCCGELDLYEDRIFGHCIHCGQKIMIDNEMAKKVEINGVKQYSLLFEEAQFAIETGDLNSAKKIGEKLLNRDPHDPHGWLVRGCLAINGKDISDGSEKEVPVKKEAPAPKPSFFGSLKKAFRREDNVPEDRYEDINERAYEDLEEFLDRHGLGDGSKNRTRAASCWKRAAQHLESQYFLRDYAEIIGTCLAPKIDEGRFDNFDYHTIIEPFVEAIENKFGIDFMSEMYHILYLCYKKYLSLLDKFTLKNSDPLSDMLLNSIAYDPDYKSLISKCRDFLNYIESSNPYLSQRWIFEQFVETFSEKTKSLSPQDRERIASTWTESRMDEELDGAWKRLFDSDYNDDEEEEEEEDARPSLFSRIFRRNAPQPEEEDEDESEDNSIRANMNIYADLYLNP